MDRSPLMMAPSSSTSYLHLRPYTPRMFWDLWLLGSAHVPDDHHNRRPRLHVYNVHENDLAEVHEAPHCDVPLLEGFHPEGERESETLRHAEEVFAYLEEDVVSIVRGLLGQLPVSSTSPPSPASSSTPCSADTPTIPSSVSLSLNHLSKLKRLLIFLRFRNSAGYASIVRRLCSLKVVETREDGTIYPAYRPLVVQMKRRYVVRAFVNFLKGEDRRESQRMHEGSDFGSSSSSYASRFGGVNEAERDGRAGTSASVEGSSGRNFVDFFHEVMDTSCWRMLDAEVCVGVVREERETGREEYILPEVCYGSLDEGFDEDPEACDFFFPLTPSISLYLLGTSPVTPPPPLLNLHTLLSIPVGLESMIDVHLRNSLILQTYPARLIFGSLKCIVCSLKSYDEFRWINEHQDYSRLRLRCRQKWLKEGVVKTLVLRAPVGSDSDQEDSDDEERDEADEEREMAARRKGRAVRVFDLTEQVEIVGEWAVGFGTFSDVYKGMWKDPMERRDRAVAVKFLRSVMVQNVKERLIRRIQAEVSTWNQLCHRNVSQFFGIVQRSSTFGMVSPWYCNGTLPDFLKSHSPPSSSSSSTSHPHSPPSSAILSDVYFPTKTKPPDRLKLLLQIASGIQHLHSHLPPIVHGDLKGGNILIDAHGSAIITDFGLSKVLEEVTQVCAGGENAPPDGTACGGKGTSVFAGSTRWMAPELILALVNSDSHSISPSSSSDYDSESGDDVDYEGYEDSGTSGVALVGPQITTVSDVYAFGSVCLEVATDELPYPHRPNDHAVILDILTSVSPRRPRAKCKVNVGKGRQGEFWGLVDRCWGMPPERRPRMEECLNVLEGMGVRETDGSEVNRRMSS